MKPILVVSCTKHKKATTRLYKSLSFLANPKELKLVIVENNTDGLPSVYNKYINQKTLKKHDIVLFVHDDVYIDDLKLRGKLYANLNSNYDIVGLAGCVKPRIKKPVLWHQMADRQHHRGYVMHDVRVGDDEYAVHCSSFGHTPSRVAIIDGLFIAINLKQILKSEWKFNEAYEFHHYDIASCIDANRKQLRIGVAPINVIHSSTGLQSLDDISWNKSQDMFIKQYGSE